LLSHIKADGFTWEQFKPFYDKPTSMDELYGSKLKSEKLEGDLTTETSSALWLMKTKMPALISNRSMLVFSYTKQADEEDIDGWRYEFGSSLGTEPFVDKYKTEIGNDVLGYTHLNMIMWRPYDGGIELQQIG